VQVVGELFDKELAQSILEDLKSKEIECNLFEKKVGERTLFIIRYDKDDLKKLETARQFFRVRLGLPGPAPTIDPEWIKLKSAPLGVVTKLLIIFCTIIYLFSFNEEYKRSLFETLFFDLNVLKPWLLITPILLHFNFFHILFNLMWLKDLGSAFEDEKGSSSFVAFVLLTGALSNYSQFIISGVRFGGMSGVVYALLGHMWVYAKTREDAKFSLPKRDIYLMVGWYFLCLSGLIGNVANMAHGVGLALGMIAGFFPLKSYKRAHLQYILYALFFIVGTYFIEIFVK